MQPLSGKNILVTRAAGQFEVVAANIRKLGANAIPFPCLEVQCLSENIRDVLKGLSSTCPILLTSANGVHCLAAALGHHLAEILNGHPLIAVGPRTAAAMLEHDMSPAWVADQASQEGLVRGFASRGMPNELCFLRAEQGRDVIQRAFEDAGIRMRLVSAYRTVCPEEDPSDIVKKLERGAIDAVLLGSSRCTAHYVQRIGDVPLADKPAVAVISAQVARAARDAGLSVQCIAKETSFSGMLDTLVKYFTVNSKQPEDTHA